MAPKRKKHLPNDVLKALYLEDWSSYTLFFLYKNVFLAQAEYSYFSAGFRLKIFLYYS